MVYTQTFFKKKKDQQDISNKWFNSWNWCWMVPVDGIVKCMGLLVNFWLTELSGLYSYGYHSLYCSVENK